SGFRLQENAELKDRSTEYEDEKPSVPCDLNSAIPESCNDANAGIIKPISDEELPEQHPLTILMHKSGRNPMVLLVCFLTAVIVAPLAEEFLFRIVIQGGIEATLRREFGQRLLAQWLPVAVTALFFAAIHFRTEQKIDPTSIDRMFQAMIAAMIGNLVAAAAIIVIFRSYYRIRWSDIGLWDFRRNRRNPGKCIRQHCRDALGAFLLMPAILIPVGIVNVTVQTLAKTQWAADLGISAGMVDPVPLFFLAMILGMLYHRTRRFAPVFFLHAFFNLFGFLVVMYMTFAE
ncbi:MAG: CPBP family intramembrane metalloprotease, partial [Planctomycetaceae bacterium]|nr:CPBP family intramembrane metalloprotease [Planctomycetaceae bacterium]